MKHWLIDLLRRFIDQTCACGAFKLSRADKCFDCSQPLADVVELAERRTGRHAA